MRFEPVTFTISVRRRYRYATRTPHTMMRMCHHKTTTLMSHVTPYRHGERLRPGTILFPPYFLSPLLFFRPIFPDHRGLVGAPSTLPQRRLILQRRKEALLSPLLLPLPPPLSPLFQDQPQYHGCLGSSSNGSSRGRRRAGRIAAIQEPALPCGRGCQHRESREWEDPAFPLPLPHLEA